MGASCCQKVPSIKAQELNCGDPSSQPIILHKESLNQQSQDKDSKQLNSAYIEQRAETPIKSLKQSIPNLKISNTKGTYIVVNENGQTLIQVPSKEDQIGDESLIKQSPQVEDQVVQQSNSTSEQPVKLSPETGAKQDRSPSNQASPQLDPQGSPQFEGYGSSRKSVCSVKSMKLGVELFVNLKQGSISKSYVVGQVLGQGAFGKVWKVTHKLTGMPRAMKQIKKSELIKEEEQKLFSEMNVLKNLDHPHIVKLFELYQDNTSYYLITEYLSGGELFDRIKKMNYFSERRASDFMRQILMGVVYCHEQKIVHRDLKPENVIFSSTDADADLKLIDFGCSRKVTGKSMTKRLGTPYYIAPEVLNQKYNEKCDVWSCGVILYILLCGYPPFTGKSEKEIFDRVKAGKIKFPAEDWDSISKEAKNLIQKMLTVNYDQRISASQALNDPWIQKHAPAHQINKKVMEQLSGFQAKSYFRQAVVQYIVSQMSTAKELEEIQKSFESLDKNNDGILTKDELIEGYYKVLKNKQQATEEVEKILLLIDTNHSGRVDYSEFVSAAMNQEKIISLKKVDQAFKIFDQNGDGFITKAELEQIMGQLDSAAWEQILHETDANGDGKISQDEFKKILMNFQI